MTRTLSIAAAILLTLMLAGAAAQTPPASPASPPAAARSIDRGDLRHQIYVMEGALVRAVAFGAQRLNRELRSVMPEVMTVSGEPQARGVYLEGYGVFFDVGVPVLHQSMVWSLRNLIGQDDKGLLEALNVIREQIKEARTPASRAALENAIERIELGLGPLGTSARVPELQFPTALAGDKTAAPAADPTPMPPPSPAPPVQAQIDRKLLKDPNAINRAYTTSVQNALIDAMIDYSLPMALGPDEFLTVGARDNMPRDSLAPPDPYEEVVTVLLRIKGADLTAYRSQQIDRVEVRKRVQVKEF